MTGIEDIKVEAIETKMEVDGQVGGGGGGSGVGPNNHGGNSRGPKRKRGKIH